MISVYYFNIHFSAKISGEITLQPYLRWPHYGYKYVIICTFYTTAWVTFIIYGNINMAHQMDIPTSSKEFIFFQVSNVITIGRKRKTLIFDTVLIDCLGPFAFQYFFIIFCLAWIEEFGFICLKYSKTAIMSHTKKCLYLYKSLQSGLGRDITNENSFNKTCLYFRNIFCCNFFCAPAINHNFSFLDNFVSLSY